MLHEEEDEMWHIDRGKPYCSDCFENKEAKRAIRKAKAEAREAEATAAVEELSGGLITDKSSCELLWRSPPETTEHPPE